MTEYKLRRINEHGFAYIHKSRDIEFNMIGTCGLTDNELSEYISDSFTHEHVHKVLHELFNVSVCTLFDLVEHHFRNDELHKKYLRNYNAEFNTTRITYKDYIQRFGVDDLLSSFNISNNIKNYYICNTRFVDLDNIDRNTISKNVITWSV